MEYGGGFTKNHLEIHSDSLDSSSKVVIVDDVISSGVTMVAAAKLVGMLCVCVCVGRTDGR